MVPDSGFRRNDGIEKRSLRSGSGGADNEMLKAKFFNAAGDPGEALDLPEDPFDGVVHETALHQAIKAYLANQRQGNAPTKKRSQVAGGAKKIWRQKGTGRARQGSIRAPHWKGGGVVFGPLPRDYR